MTEQNTISDLRTELFATIRALRDKHDPMDVARAKEVADVAGRIIDSAKAETEYVRAFGARGASPSSGFIGAAPAKVPLHTQAHMLEGAATEPVPGNGLPPTGPMASL